jgi:hypothetical protein
MTTRFPCLNIVGGLFASDLIDQIFEGIASGQKPTDFKLSPRTYLTDEIAAAWTDARSLWATFQHRLERLAPDDIATSTTRDQWMIPLLSLLGYELSYVSRAAEVDGLTYAVSHRAGQDENAPPVHIVGSRQSLDRRPESGRPRLAPHSLLQEFINRTEHLWGVVTNGYTLRLLRDSQLIRRQAYIEFDLKQMMESEKFSDFGLLFRLVHRSRLPRGLEDITKCLLEQYYFITIEQGGRVRDHLRDGVEEALKFFANGFLHHFRNQDLRDRLTNNKLNPDSFYQQLLRLIYRILFLMVSEERNLITEAPIYREHYSISRLRQLAELRSSYSEHEDFWMGLRTAFRLFQDERLGNMLGVPPLNGDLFDTSQTPDLIDTALSNHNLLTAIWHLSMYRENEKTPWRRINYAALDVEELGSVYESLLDFQPIFSRQNGKPSFNLVSGTERKSTGSYYTPPELVNELIKSALVPVLEERLKDVKSPQEKEKRILNFKVCDPASGSGHFLLAAARRLGRELAKIQTGDDEPAPEQMRLAIRDVITHCIYGVDKNPLAVDLCKVALWIEGHAKGKPLTFLDHRIRCGDSLVGVSNFNVLKDGIPDDAYNAVTGDDKKTGQLLKKSNRDEREEKHPPLLAAMLNLKVLSENRRLLVEVPDDTPEQIKQKVKEFQKMQSQGTDWWHDQIACHLWTTAFFAELTPENDKNKRIPTTDDLHRYMETHTLDGRLIGIALALSQKYRFFHWPLEFPEVFTQNGFDVMLGNPPWEKIKLQEREFFAIKAPEIANAQTASKRRQMIEALRNSAKDEDRQLYESYLDALRMEEAQNKFVRGSQRFLLTGKGDVNTYALFAELFSNLIGPQGRLGVIVKTGIASDETTKDFFSDMVNSHRIASLIDFSNKNGIFPAVIANERFCLLTAAATGRGPEAFTISVLNETFDQISDLTRTYTLTAEDVRRINPNTRTCPLFYNRDDARVCRYLYDNNPVLIDETNEPPSNPWGIEYCRMFDMTNDSSLFRDKEWLIENGFTLKGNEFHKGKEAYIPLYEGKFFNLFDYRYGTFDGVPRSKRFGIKAETKDPKEHLKSNPTYEIEPRYWVNRDLVVEEYKRKSNPCDAAFMFRDVCRTFTDSRTARGTLVPFYGAGNTAPILFFHAADDKARVKHMVLFTCIFSSFVFDFVVRQKISSAHLNRFTLIQICTPPPEAFEKTLSFGGIVKTSAKWLLEQAPALLCNTNSMLLFFRHHEITKPIPWNPDLRHKTMCFVDAIVARIYGLSREDYAYILTRFPILRSQEADKYGEFRSERLCLDAWDKIDG